MPETAPFVPTPDQILEACVRYALTGFHRIDDEGGTVGQETAIDKVRFEFLADDAARQIGVRLLFCDDREEENEKRLAFFTGDSREQRIKDRFAIGLPGMGPPEGTWHTGQTLGEPCRSLVFSLVPYLDVDPRWPDPAQVRRQRNLTRMMEAMRILMEAVEPILREYSAAHPGPVDPEPTLEPAAHRPIVPGGPG